MFLESKVKKAQANDEHVAYDFFTWKKTYDLPWRHGILKVLYDVGVPGRMFNFKQNFLKP